MVYIFAKSAPLRGKMQLSPFQHLIWFLKIVMPTVFVMLNIQRCKNEHKNLLLQVVPL